MINTPCYCLGRSVLHLATHERGSEFCVHEVRFVAGEAGVQELHDAPVYKADPARIRQALALLQAVEFIDTQHERLPTIRYRKGAVVVGTEGAEHLSSRAPGESPVWAQDTLEDAILALANFCRY